MKNDNLKNKILQMDIRDIVNILSKNIFLILFSTLLGLIIGYFSMNQDTDERKFNIQIDIPEVNYENKEILEDITDNLYKIALLEKEKIFIQHLIKINPQLPILAAYPQLIKTRDDFIVTKEFINIVILDYFSNPNLYSDTILTYNEKVKEDFPNETDQTEYIIDKNLTYHLEQKSVNNRNISSLRVFFAKKYSDYLAENYVKIFLKNVNDHLYEVVLKKIDKTFDSYYESRSLLKNFLIFALDKHPSELRYFETNFPDFDSKVQYGFAISESGIFEKKIDLFHNSSNIDQTFNKRYKITYHAPENNGVAWSGILGFLIGVILSFASNLYYQKRNMK